MTLTPEQFNKSTTKEDIDRTNETFKSINLKLDVVRSGLTYALAILNNLLYTLNRREYLNKKLLSQNEINQNRI